MLHLIVFVLLLLVTLRRSLLVGNCINFIKVLLFHMNIFPLLALTPIPKLFSPGMQLKLPTQNIIIHLIHFLLILSIQ